jgi:hypothetical protein
MTLSSVICKKHKIIYGKLMNNEIMIFLQRIVGNVADIIILAVNGDA